MWIGPMWIGPIWIGLADVPGANATRASSVRDGVDAAGHDRAGFDGPVVGSVASGPFGRHPCTRGAGLHLVGQRVVHRARPDRLSGCCPGMAVTVPLAVDASLARHLRLASLGRYRHGQSR